MIITMVIIDLDDNRQCLKTLSETWAEAGRPNGRKDSGAGQLLRDSAAAATLCLTTSSRDQQVCSRTHSALSTRTKKHSAPVCVDWVVAAKSGASL